ncbi:MAG: family 16 glycoside hydrolase [Sandaracinaceae bacterium]
MRRWSLRFSLSISLGAAGLSALALGGCTPQGDPAIGPEGFLDTFDREDVGDDWHNTGGRYRIEDGQLNIQGARNRPLWLRRRLPRDVRIELDVRSESPQGDIKLEVFGDGTSRATSESYTATSYVVIFGGWNNSLNVMARMDEHAEDRVVGPPRRVEQGRTYHMRIERRGDTITAWVDDQQLVQMVDPDPLEGRGHDHFAFNDWEANLFFDNLRIVPL